MTRFHKMLRVLAVGAFLGAGLIGRAEAAPIVSISPSTTLAATGSTFSVDLIVSGLTGLAGGAVGGLGATVSFDDAVLTGVSYAIGAGLFPGAAGASDLSFGFFAAGVLDLFFGVDPAIGGAALAAAQGTGFVLATLTFNATAAGVSGLTLSDVALSDPDGFALASGSANGKVCVSAAGGPCPAAVPEPASFLLLSATGLAFAVRRRLARPRA